MLFSDPNKHTRTFPLKQEQRATSIDVLRGLALAGMLLVNNPGSWANVYWPFLHAPWHGLRPTDLVFPFFLFVVGAAMSYSFRQQIIDKHFDWLSICRRSILLISIGILLSAIPYQQSLSEWRIPGVLQRIGLCYLLSALILRLFSPKKTIIFSICLLVFYWLVLVVFSAEPYSMQGNVVRVVDLWVMGESHMYKGLGFAFDPEGLLSTLPATVTCLLGYQVALHLQSLLAALQKIKFLLSVGALFIAVGMLWHVIHPMNKSLWTGSYVLVTSGIACLVLALITSCWDCWKLHSGLQALRVYGSNPILLFVLAGLAARFLIMFELNIDGQMLSIKTLIYQNISHYLPAKVASLAFAVVFMLCFYPLALYLYRKKIFIKL